MKFRPWPQRGGAIPEPDNQSPYVKGRLSLPVRWFSWEGRANHTGEVGLDFPQSTTRWVDHSNGKSLPGEIHDGELFDMR